jgi:hypothetical protein
VRPRRQSGQENSVAFPDFVRFRAGPYDNRHSETTYFWTDNDTQLNQLDGNSLYAVVFPKGQVPPVKGLWSLTMYDPQHFFYANDLRF